MYNNCTDSVKVGVKNFFANETGSVYNPFGKNADALQPGGSGTQISGTSYDASLLRQTQPYVDQNEVKGLVEYISVNGPNSVDPILVRVHEGTAYIVDGHHRYNAFLQLGYERVPIKYLHSSNLGKIQSDGTFIRMLEDILAGANLCE